jgi:sugar phosphate isomerase/epimerase
MPSFHLSILTDEISQDFGHALEVAARSFGLGWVELRAMWNKNIVGLDAAEVAEARRLLEKYQLRVAAIASPLFKVDWPGAPRSRYSPTGDQFGADFTYEQQDEVLERTLELAHAFGTSNVRCFDFWRLDDPAPYRAAIDLRLVQAADRAARRKVTLAVENEYACNTATGAEAARLLSAIRHPAIALTWDAGNAAWRGETPYPDGYARLPKDRIVHVHCKDIVRASHGEAHEWVAMGRGIIDWVGQFRALNQDGYSAAASLETHWRGAGTPEASSDQSLAGMRALLARAGVT